MVLSGKGVSGEKFSPLASKVFRERYHHLARRALENVMDLQGNVGDKILLGTHHINTKNGLSFSSGETWRLVNANEKELLLGYGYKHTEVAWAASKIKQNQIGYSDARNSYLGDSFSIYSFVMFAVACSKKFLPVLTYKQLALRMGLAPGFRASLRTVAPWGNRFSMGPPSKVLIQLDGDPNNSIGYWLRRTNHTGSDVRVTSGEVMNS